MSEHISPNAPETHKVAAMDVFAVSLSSLCVVHCLAMPVLLVLLPSLAALPIADESFHFWLVFLVIPTSVAALFLGCRRHRKWSVLAWGLSGVGVLVFAALFGHDMLGEAGEKIMTVVGSVMVAISHALNYRLCRSSSCSH